MRLMKMLLVTALVACPAAMVQAQDSVRPKVMSEEELKPIENVFLHMASEREKVVQYHCDVDIKMTPNVVSQPATHFELGQMDRRHIFLHVEYSQPEGYRLAYTKQSAESPILFLDGETRESKFVYSKNQGIRVEAADPTADTHKGLDVPAYFDPLGVGFGFFGDHAFGRSSNDVLQDHLTHWCDGLQKVEMSSSEGVIELRREFTSFKVDSRKSYWPISYEYGDYASSPRSPTTWHVEVAEVKDGIYLPRRATIKFGPVDSQVTQELIFTWTSVNEDELAGIEAARKIATLGNFGFKDSRN